MDVAGLSDSEIRAAFTAAAGGDCEAVVRCAAMLEEFDQLDDAAWMWRLGDEAGNVEARQYCAAHLDSSGSHLLSGPQGDVLEAVLDRDRERAVACRPELAAWIQDGMANIRKTVVVCAIHGAIEVDRPDDYKSCGECLHVWRTEADFVADVQRADKEHRQAILKYEGVEPGPDSSPPQERSFCPLCTHDF